MTHSLISVIVPVYNAGRFLGETLDALSRQSHEELEILCVDDGSTDDSSDIIKSHIKKDPRIKYIHQANAGPGAARNKGIELANGKYIAFQDSDDLLCPEMLDILAENLERFEADVSICGFSCCDEDACVPSEVDVNYTPEVVRGDIASAFRDSKRFRGHPWGKLYRRDIIGDIRFNDLRSGEDTYFNIDVAARSHCVVIVPLPLYIYRQAASSLTHNAKHHENSIVAGKEIGLHCIELYRGNAISREALVGLVRRYSTDAICLHLILMAGNPLLSNEQRKSLLLEACDYVSVIRQRMPVPESVFSLKYRWIYLFAIKPHSLLVLRFICGLRKAMLKMLTR